MRLLRRLTHIYKKSSSDEEEEERRKWGRYNCSYFCVLTFTNFHIPVKPLNNWMISGCFFPYFSVRWFILFLSIQISASCIISVFEMLIGRSFCQSVV